MKIKLTSLWDRLRASYWFVPGLMALGAIGLAFGVVALDQRVDFRTIRGQGWIYTGAPEGARGVLATVASAVMTVAGVTFSITIAALSLASQQFGPRLLRNFMTDRGNQVVLGTFIATFLYCLLVLRTIRGLEEQEFVPHIAVTLGVLLAMASMGVLIYFINHVAASIQVANIIATVGEELDRAIVRLFPDKLGHGDQESGEQRKRGVSETRCDTPCSVSAPRGGYIQAIDSDRLMQIAIEGDLLLRLERRPGEHVVPNSALMWVGPASHINDAVTRRIGTAFTFGRQRTVIQDARFGVHQLVEIAVRALSPGVNDPFTAMMCLDRLGESLCLMAQREIPSPHRYDDQGTLRVIAESVTFRHMADAAFHPFRQYGRSSVAVTIRLLETMTQLTDCISRAEDRATLLRHAALIVQGSRDAIPEEADRREIEARYQEALRRLQRG